ncbi:hypothetical protein [uncultured Psychroserpens sp.]|uniref:hypothetical protein n=1 Tax=uncultured Psychroserpens sp. TaxID=255436 RepID=UPI002617EFD8|nr:hypothetical protein [uncultured Psychroserpens sp.]
MKKLIVLISMLIASMVTAQNEIPENGNVGINTTTPTQELEVNGITKTNQLIVGETNTIPFFVNAWLEGGFSSQLFLNSSLSQTNERLWALSAINGSFKIFSESDDFSSIKEAFVINRSSGIEIENVLFPNGNVGIGTSSFVEGDDTYRLSVNGKIRAHGVKVYTTWADYVFEDSYELKPLDEIENYIKERGHLPNIPSEEEVLKNGIELGEINKLLLEKIEELTLYMIDQDKKIKSLQRQLDTLTKN